MNSTKLTKKFISPLTWVGGKAKQWNLIKSLFPQNSKNLNYIEPFFGGGSVGLNALNENLFKKYLFNDLEEKLMSFWSCLPSCQSQFKEEFFYPNLISLRKAKTISQWDMSSTAQFIMNNNLTFNGQMFGNWTILRLKQNWNLNKRQRILGVANLLEKNKKRIKLGNLDYKEWLKWTKEKKYEDNFYYLDPPYFSNKGKPYRKNFKNKDWIEFQNYLEILTNDGSKFLLSIDDCPETREMFSQYNIHTAEWTYSSSNTRKNKCKKGKELFITNY